ncbi:TIGR02117 family protein [Mucilaginibacter glaciei]|uniref:TIGR02117 family protein n=1 Tax=Mucilaginibacter glaciei TaxID=2772109 RepID=A0A926NNP2_9SPHI|nr:TIGR02117 family protein [Mucilaginibacter glaciei]MBD1391867.1 TIGR02117 family protein [Mucilaginibacter glaciei]
MKKSYKVLLHILLGLVAFVVLYLLAAFLIPKIGVPAEKVTDKTIDIYILTNGVHTDLVVPLRSAQLDWSKQVKFENTKGKDTTAKWIAFGWGDKVFYLSTPTWAQLRFSVAFKAAFALSTSAMHATFYKGLKENASCKRVKLSTEQYTRLVAYIQNSFQTNAAGNVIKINTNANYDDSDAFYEATRRYNLFYTCNTWANNALKACGQRACLWTPRDQPIFDKY